MAGTRGARCRCTTTSPASRTPLARAQLERAFARWEELIRVGLAAAVARGELPPAADVDRTALALLAAVEGGLLVSQVRRNTVVLEAAIDAFVDYLRVLADGQPGVTATMEHRAGYDRHNGTSSRSGPGLERADCA